MPLGDLQDRLLRGDGALRCPSCGAPHAADQRYCLHCGSAIHDVLRQLVGPRQLGPRAGPAPPARPAIWPLAGSLRGAAAALACALGVGVLAGALAGPTGSEARRVVALDAPAPQTTPSPPAGDLGDLQAAVPAQPRVASPRPSSSGASDATDGVRVATPDPKPAARADSGDDETKKEKTSPAAAKPAKPRPSGTLAPPPVKHVVVVALADKGFAEAFGADSKAPYLARELREKGALLRRYHATAHGSLPNLVALLSGQAANPDTATGCPALAAFVVAGKPKADGEVRGTGCVFDATVASLPQQLDHEHRAWHAYVDGAAPAGAPAPCLPPPAQPDGTPAVVDRNPLLFFAAIAAAADCTAKVSDLATLAADLAAPAEHAPAFSLIVPDACSAGRDGACPAGEPSGLPRSDGWLREWIPRLLASPAYADDGMIVITFDQARVAGRRADSASCCGQPVGVNQPASIDPQAPAPGGGRVGALVLSPRVRAGIASDVPYNHFSLLRTIEDAFSLHHLGLAGRDGLRPLGDDVFGAR